MYDIFNMGNVILLGLTSLLTDISSEMVYPLIPLFLTTQLHVTPAVIGLIEGFAESIASLLKVFSGYFSDLLRRRKPFTIFGYAFSTLGKLILYVSTGWVHVFVGRLADRFGKGMRTAPRDALIADSTAAPVRGQVYGLHRTMDTVGALTGIIIVYFFLTVGQTNYRHLFLWSLLPAIAGVLVLFFVREKKVVPPDIPAGETGKNKFVFSVTNIDRRVWVYLGITFIFNLGNSSNQFLLLRANSLGFTSQTVILFYLTYNIVYAILSFPAGWVSDRVGRKPVLCIGYAVYGIIYLCFALLTGTNSINLILLFASYGIYMAFTEGVEKAFLTDLATAHLRATVIGLHATLVGIALLPASLIAGLLWNYFGASAPFYFGSVTGIIAAISVLLLI